MTDNLPTRRELRDRERAIQERMAAEQFLNQQPAVVVPPAPVAAPVASPVVDLPPAQPTPNFAPVVSQATVAQPPVHGRRAAAPVEQSLPVYIPPVTAAPIESTQPGTIPNIPLVREIETNTNSIVLDVVPTLENTTIVIKSADEQTRLIRTGAIDLPPLQTITGEVEVVRAASVVDQQLEAAATGSSAVLIEPQPARTFSARKRDRVFPGKLSKGMGSVHTVLATAIIMATLGAVFVIAFMLKLI